MIVDGFTDPSQEDNRICLGLLSNVNRNITIENTRRHIGRGLRFICSETLVTVYNSSQYPAFVQSQNSNFKYNLQSTSVCRVPAGSSMIVFDYQLFHNVSLSSLDLPLNFMMFRCWKKQKHKDTIMCMSCKKCASFVCHS